ncbi:hypothetical protein M9H77_35894 [Catharanthus roseus]|uniref:Uncharacterized protein n=1 Tax=Catharanthus roseus TaxID=4058 RepID=A0ACB9ZS27_CATRO|nr:hypothetical protein M9H77_35894 [Catharanthus roseus]
MTFWPEFRRIASTSDGEHTRSLGPATGTSPGRLVQRPQLLVIAEPRDRCAMVRPGARGDDDLGAVTDRTGRVERRDATVHQTYRPLLHLLHWISYNPYTHAPSLPIRMRGLDPTQHFSRTQIPLNDVSGPRLQLGAKFFEQLAGSVPVDSSYSGAEYGATAHGISSSDVGLGRDSGTSRSEEASRVCSLLIHSSEGNEDEREDDDDDDSDDDGDDHEPVPVVEASFSGHRPAPGKGKGFTGSLMSVMSKIARLRQKRPEKSHPPTNPTQRKKSKNDDWEQTGPADDGPQDPVIVPSYSGHVAGCIWCG